MNSIESPDRPRGSLVGLLFTLIFGGVFAFIGLMTFLFGLTVATGTTTDPGSFVPAVVGAIFLVAGIGIIVIGLKTRRAGAGRSQLRADHPEEPWLWRADWAAGRIRSSMTAMVMFVWFFALFWNLISWTVAPLALSDFGPENRFALIVLVFPLIGLFLLGWALVLTRRVTRYGSSILELATIPAVIGGVCRGRIVSSKPFEPDDGVELRLVCLEVTRTGNHKDSSTHETVIWDSRRKLQSGDLGQDGRETVLPVDFVIPYGLPSSSNIDPDLRTVWRVQATADMIGVDYSQSFEIPAFTTADSSADVVELPSTPVDVDSADRRGALLENSPIGFKKLDGGAIEIWFPAGRNLGACFGLGFFGLIWGAVVVVLMTSDAPLIFPVIFGFFEVLLLALVVHLAFAAALIHVRPDGLGYEKRVFGFIRRGWHPRNELTQLGIDVGMQSGDRCWYRLMLRLGNGRSVTLGSGIPSRDEALALKSVAEEVLGIAPEAEEGEPEFPAEALSEDD